MTFVCLATRALSRRSAALTRISFVRGFSAKAAGENPEGPMLGGYEEFLDDLKTKTDKMEASLGNLKDTYGKKQEMMNTVKWTDPEEMEYLFDMSRRHKQEMEEQLVDIKKSIQAMKTNFAVDAPDGESDGHVEEELEAVKFIIDHTDRDNKNKKAA
ncbi:expressed unknown protein [Seminavis robusta]|uniref:Uncharacterized protein n=1 Tax=Seminavis robusta TaxID=568900 RepID=A0A9N8ECS9_9STRA|nr:expressed unknown protein [Seminavis robusta]|eukprot:Sro934_g221860.1 n/a (157) ;mRNA; f:22191-22661